MKKRTKIILAVVLVVLACIGGFLGWNWYQDTYITIDAQTYRRDVTELDLSGSAVQEVDKLAELTVLEKLDLRDTGLTVEQYEQLRQALPECRILWSVPFQDGYCAMEETVVTVTELSGEDVERMAYLEALTTVDAVGCRDYEVLMALKEANPELDVRYTVQVGGKEYREDTTELTLENGDPEEIETALHYLPDLTKVELTGNVPDNERIYEWMCLRPDVMFEWEFELFGVLTSSTATELNLSNIPMESTDEVEAALKYFYNLERVEMCDCGIPSEEMDALGKRHPETRFVWTIRIGTGSLRTDATAFIPYKLGYDINNPLYDEQLKDLKYCVDMVCLDLGHMRMKDVSFLYNMPKLQFLILADTVVEDFTPLAGLTEMVFLELFRSPFTDVELLMNMKKLEELNIGWTDLENPELLMEMTWLKRLWATMSGLTLEQYKQLQQALPDTYVYVNSAHPTEGGWRRSERYYEMRDMLDMHYMD